MQNVNQLPSLNVDYYVDKARHIGGLIRVLTISKLWSLYLNRIAAYVGRRIVSNINFAVGIRSSR